MRRFDNLFLLMFMVVFYNVSASFADVKLPSLFDDNMVLQRDMKITLWGWADPGEEIKVSINSLSEFVKADKNGDWKVKLEPMTAGGPFKLIIEAKNIIAYSNVMVGDVWICSGQSNMEMRVRHVVDSDNEVADALYPNLRLFQIKNDLSPAPRNDCEGSWEVCRPSTVGDFSAAGYFFGRKIMQETNVPIGLINASWGGTTVEAWISIDAQYQSNEFRNILDHWKPVLEKKSPEILSFYRKMAEWEEDVHYVEYVGKPGLPIYGTPPKSPVKLSIVPQLPVWVYNAMIAPLVPYAIKGVIWYQGESNAGRAYQYRKLFPSLIRNWRRLWNQGNFPFLFVQLANYGKSDPHPGESAWAELREAQLMTLSLSNTAMAVAIDLGEADNIHPGNKQDVGYRLALGALKVAYGENIIHSGPVFDTMNIEGGRIHLRFSCIGEGLVSKNNDSVKGFTIAGEDRKFSRAKAVIIDNEVTVWNEIVTDPIAVRYGWANNPDCNLYNCEGLPASPFRTDDWHGITVNKK
ncbi:MAG: sialate O-acetylesterase [Candidatus Latescibacteria bacterium]|nr:sialate O-acetylesterase [Candidatus Latescibacterota bacterium]